MNGALVKPNPLGAIVIDHEKGKCDMKNMNPIVRDTLLTIGLLIAIAIPLVLTIYLINNDREYIIIAVMSLLFFTISIGYLITQKRFSLNSVMGLVAGVLFLASSIFGYRSGTFTNKISTGFLEFGLGIMLLLINLITNDLIKNSLVPIAQVPKLKKLSLFSVLVAIMAFLFGIFLFINEFYHLY